MVGLTIPGTIWGLGVKCVIDVYSRGKDFPLSPEGHRAALQSRTLI
jgi:hypothetical protein